MPTARSGNVGPGTSNSSSAGEDSSPRDGGGGQNGRSERGEDVEELERLDQWLEEDPVSVIPNFIRPEMLPDNSRGRGSTSRSNGDGSENSRPGYHRSRMFVNQKFSNKQSKGMKKTEDIAVGGFGGTWDTPLLELRDAPKLYMADREMLMSLRSDRTSENTDVTECSHLIVHTSCHCSPDCTYAVCTNCFLIFCDLPCLQSGLSTAGKGKVAASSENHLDSPFGLTTKDIMTGSQHTPVPARSTPKGSLDAKVQRAIHPAMEPVRTGVVKTKFDQKSEGPSRPFSGSGKQDNCASSDFKLQQSSTLTTKPDSVHELDIDRVRRHNSYDKNGKDLGPSGRPNQMNKSSSSTSFKPKKPIQQSPTGIFRQKSGFQESFQEQPSRPFSTRPLNKFELELGGKGHFDNEKSGPDTSTRDMRSEFKNVCEPRGRGRGRGRGVDRGSFHPLMPGNPNAPDRTFRSNSGLLETPDRFQREDHEPTYRNVRDDRYHPDRLIHDNPAQPERIYRMQQHSLLSQSLPSHRDRVLRDPLVNIHNRMPNSADLEPPPVYRGRGRGPTSKSLIEDSSYSARVDNNVSVRLTKPLRGVNDRNSKPEAESTSKKKTNLPTERRENDKDIGVALKKFLRIDLESDSESSDNRNSNIISREPQLHGNIKDAGTSSAATLKPTRTFTSDSVGNNKEENDEGGVEEEMDDMVPYCRNLAVPIENEIEVPLGVKVMMKITNVVDVHCIYLTWIGAPRFEDPKKLNNPDVKLKLKASSRVGDYCVVYHEGDMLNNQGYYRGHITGMVRGVCEILLIDIGTVIELPERKLFTMPKEYRLQRRLAIRLGLKKVDPTGNPDLEFQARTCLESTLACYQNVMVLIKYISTLENTSSPTKFWGDLFDKDGRSASVYLEEDGFAVARKEKGRFKNMEMYKATVPKHSASKIRCLTRTENFKSRILQGAKTMSRFFVIKEKEEELHIKVVQLISRAASLSLPPYHPWVLGTGNLCVVEHAEDGKWYRGKIASIDENVKANVTLIDTGEDQKVPVKDLKEIPHAVKEIPALAFLCSLPIEVVESDIESIMVRFYKLNDLCNERGLIAWVLEKIGRESIIDFKLLSEGTTWCTALEAVKGANIKCNPEIALRIRNEVSGDNQLKFLATPEELATNQTYRFKTQHTVGLGHGFELNAPENEDGEVPSTSQITNSLKDSTLTTKEKKCEDYPEFHYTRLKKLAPLNNMKGKVFLFNRVTGLPDFNIFSLLEKSEGELLYTALEKAIQDCIATGEADFKPDEVLVVNQVVLAPFAKTRYQRAKVEEVKSGSDSINAFVRFLEHGMVVRFPISELKRANRTIMNIPEIVYFVRLYGVEDDIPVLESDFNTMRIALEKRVVLGREVNTQHRTFPSVILFTEGEEPKNLSTVINNLAVWQWQRLFRVMFCDFKQLASQYNWSLRDVSKFWLDKPITELLKRSALELKVQMTKVIDKTLYISGNPGNENVIYQARTIQTQMAKYFEKVESSEMSGTEVTNCPHIFGVQLNEAELKKKNKDVLQTMCTWHRCYYNFVEEAIICMDCFWQTKDKSENGSFPGLSIRQLTPDFYNACPVGITCKIDLSFVEAEFMDAVIQSFFPKGKDVPLTLMNLDPTCEHGLGVYQAQVPGMKRIVLDQFGPQANLGLDA